MSHSLQARSRAMLLWLALLTLPSAAQSQTPPPVKPLTAQQHERLQKRDDLRKEAQKLRAAAKFTAAIPFSEKALALESEVLGESAIETFRSTQSLAWSCAVSGDFAAARRWVDTAEKSQAQVRPAGYWTLVDVQRTRAAIDRLSRFEPAQLDRLREASQLLARTDEMTEAAEYQKPIPLVARAVEIYKQELGPQNPGYLIQLNLLGWLNMSSGNFDQAEALIREALAGLQKALGEDHPNTATAHNTLGLLLLRKKRYADAQPQFRQSADINGRILGKLSSNYASSLGNLAETFKLLKDYRRAEALDQEVVEITRQTLGENHKNYARVLAELGFVQMSLGEYDKAAPVLKQALEVDEKTLGAKHPHAIMCLGNLSYSYQQTGKLDEALTLQLRVIELKKQILPPNDRQLGFELSNASSIYVVKQNYAKALDLEQQALEIFRQAAPKGDNVSSCLGNVGWLHEQIGYEAQKRDDLTTARSAFENAVEVYSAAFGKDHWRVTDVRIQVDYVNRLEKMTADQRRELVQSTELFDKAYALEKRKFAEALAPAEQALAIRRKLLGDEYWLTINSTRQIGFLHRDAGDFAQAEPIYAALPELVRKALGERHPSHVTALQNLANLELALGKYEQSEARFLQAIEIAQKIDGGVVPTIATIFGNLGYLYRATGRYDQAEQMYRQAMAKRKEVDGSRSADYAGDLLRLSSLYMHSMRDHVKAEPLIREAIDIYKTIGSDQDSGYARAVDYLATFYTRSDRYDLAEPLYQQALAIRKQTLGVKHPDYRESLNNLAVFYEMTKDYARAEPLLVQALETTSNKKDLDAAIMLANLARVYQTQGKFAQAEPLLREVLEIRKTIQGERNPDYAEALSELAAIYLSINEPDRGLPMARDAVHGAREQLDRNQAFQSERQQLASRTRLWNVLDHYLDIAGAAGASADDAYDEVLNWKGLVSAGQQQQHRLLRQLKATGDKEVTRLVDELETSTGQLAALYRASNLKNREMQFRLNELSERVEQIQKQLAAASADFRAQQQQRRTTADIRRALPADTVLIDIVGYRRVTRMEAGKAVNRPNSLVAFVVRRQGSAERVELGPAEPIEKAITNWRRHFGRKSPTEDPAEELRRLVWQPLEKQVAGAKTLLISPNSSTAPMPWPALRIKDPDICLLDQFAVAIVPIARSLPEILAHAPVPEPTATEPKVLLVGDVDFGVAPRTSDLAANSHSSVRGQSASAWQSLPGTRQEVAAIKDSVAKRFGNSSFTELSGTEATESAIREQAEKHRYIHFSTHGFFAPPEVASASSTTTQFTRSSAGSMSSQQDVSGFHPGLLSGLVLAGANRPIEENQEDGILTALEVAEMDLDGCELATLSACETGLGATGGGEGLLGLQRAFQAAGAKTVIAGLWKVPDEATQVLMSRFYDNLWQKRLSKVEALREAQLWMLREGGRPNGRSTRGLALDDDQPADDGKQLPPYYWAAFVLSGDWR